MRFFLDNCVPESVALVLIQAGHEVIRQRKAIAPDAADPVVAIASAENEAILVSCDKDFKEIASRFGVSHGRLRKLSRIHIRCSGPKAAARMKTSLDIVAFEWQRAQGQSDTRMFIEIQTHAVKSQR